MYIVNTLFPSFACCISIGFEYLIRSMLTNPGIFMFYLTNQEHVHCSRRPLAQKLFYLRNGTHIPTLRLIAEVKTPKTSQLERLTILANKSRKKHAHHAMVLSCLFAFWNCSMLHKRTISLNGFLSCASNEWIFPLENFDWFPNSFRKII